MKDTWLQFDDLREVLEGTTADPDLRVKFDRFSYVEHLSLTVALVPRKKTLSELGCQTFRLCYHPRRTYFLSTQRGRTFTLHFKRSMKLRGGGDELYPEAMFSKRVSWCITDNDPIESKNEIYLKRGILEDFAESERCSIFLFSDSYRFTEQKLKKKDPKIYTSGKFNYWVQQGPLSDNGFRLRMKSFAHLCGKSLIKP